MMYELTKKEIKEQEKELIKFCKENHCLMYNYMMTIKKIRKEPEDKILMEKLKKQAEDYKRKIKYSIFKDYISKKNVNHNRGEKNE